MRRLAVTVVIAFFLLAGVGTARAELEVVINKSTQQMSVVIDGSVRYVWRISTGRDVYSTPNGSFVPERLERTWFSKSYYNSPMPYAIFFHNGYAIHGSYAIDQLGGPASHGCVRLHPDHAAILFELVQQAGPENTRIVVTGASAPNTGPGPYRNLDNLIEAIEQQCNDKAGPRTGNGSNPACARYRAAGELVDSRPNPDSAVTPPPDPPSNPAQPHTAYRLLPKSYWSGAAWRWRGGLD
jgi:hypothetical protein